MTQNQTHLETKTFRVVTISQNTNSFGLSGVILMAQDGEAFQVAVSRLVKDGLSIGMDLNIPYDTKDKYSFIQPSPQFFFEIPEALPKPPQGLIDEVWKNES